MPFQNPDHFKIVGLPDDLLGNRQISRARPIGGGKDVDGEDETKAQVENAIQAWTNGNRCVVSGLTSFGQGVSLGGPQAPIHTTSQPSGGAHDELGELLCTLGRGRKSVTVFVDHEDCDIQVEAFDLADPPNSLASGSTDGTGRSQASIVLSVGDHTDVRFVARIKRKADPDDGLLYSLRVAENKSDLDKVVNADPEYVFRKIDDSMYGAEKCLNAALLQRADAALQAAYYARTRRTGMWWPSALTTGGAEVSRPVMAAHTTVAYPLSLWKVTPGAKTISNRLLTIVSAATVYFDLAVWDIFGSGSLSTIRANTPVFTSATSQVVDLKANVAGFGGREVVLLLLVRSTKKTSSVQNQLVPAGTHMIKDETRIKGFSGITFTDGDRWVVEFLENPSDSFITSGTPRPAPRTIIIQDGDEAVVYPTYREQQTESRRPSWAHDHSYICRVTELGRAEILSMELGETEMLPRASLMGAYRSGMATSATAIRALYMREREQWVQRTRVHCGLWSPDLGEKTDGDPDSLFGPFTGFDPADGFQEMGACLVGDYSSAEDKDEVVHHRSSLVIRGLLQAVSHQPAQDIAKFKVKVVIGSWGGSDWDLNEVTSEVMEVDVVPLNGADLYKQSAWLSRTANSVLAGVRKPHFLRGAMDLQEVRRGEHGLVPFEVTVKDTVTNSPYRLLRLHIEGPVEDESGVELFGTVGSQWLAGWSVSTKESAV